ncbi:hypothetical protein LTR56_004466 [Elasticomyces elasticus]|nr:hypothetical protein LTR22_016882 [Elasticomyces elasticus]KAK3653612.1 hypothetical protein LTR56_004466 [Elasticomyces elasticus]KAK4916487.1 hypothetical protein LTR49_015455 [Elasticomyces elasticus]KAK5755743.1 hypothetical protein LTS12_014096 [Elasticomyces elasticus]
MILPILVSLWAPLVIAGFPPTPEGVTTLSSKFHSGVKISYKEPGICETTPGVKSYSGYVHLPPQALDETHEQNRYPLNTFFWFFESRTDPHNAPLAIWLNGGPGGSSLMGALSENGPCFVGNDSNSTYLNPWSWNNEVNLLYIDQPNQVGFSYDTPTNVTAILQKGDYEGGWRYETADFEHDLPIQNLTYLTGTTGSQNVSHTANTTEHAAVALWHFAQTWFEEFPLYKPDNNKISLFTESYGGHYGPTFVNKFMRQNELISNGTISKPGAHYLHLDTLGIINGCIDFIDGVAWAYGTFPYNNTYGIKAFNDTEYRRGMHELSIEGGIIAKIEECRRQQRKLDQEGYGDQEKVNEACLAALGAGQNVTADLYNQKGRNGWFDISHPAEDPFPAAYPFGFLNQHWVQKALGVPVNHSMVSPAVYDAFTRTGDMAKGGLLEDLAYILDHGVKVALLYGDRDYACNWVQGENSSLKIPWSSQHEFKAAGYTPLVVSPVHSGGLTRQYGNLSFTRVYQSGHLVPSYQPEAAYLIFMRALLGKDIATGTVDAADYASTGPSDTWWMRNDVLPSPPNECYVLNTGTCTDEQQEWIFDGSAIVENWIVVGRDKSRTISFGQAESQQPLI